MSVFKLTYKSFGERSILIEWPNKIDETILKDVLEFKNRLKKSNVKYLVDINSSYNSLLISYKYTIENVYDAFLELKSLYKAKDNIKKPINKLWKIPVCYDPIMATDLVVFSKKKGMKKEAVIKLHASAVYTVYFIGFLPGFLYLGGLDKKLHYPRKNTPDLNVKKGAVAIGGEQTGIYPQSSPGGWHIIGNSPVNFFDINKEKPCFAEAGDKLQFVSVDYNTYQDIATLVAAGVYQLESEVYDD